MNAEPDNHVAAVLAARAHIAAGWAIRGAGRIEDLSGRELRRMAEHYNAAERILSHFVTRGSALVAEARYFVCLGLENGHELIRSRYEAWIATDPECVAPFQVHGFHLLPRWYGDLEELEAEARRAAEATAPARGTAGYVIFHGGVIACGADDETLPGIDPELFVRSALDRARTAGSQWGANRMGEFLMLAMLRSTGEARAIYREGLTELVRSHLRVLVPAAWTSPIDDVRWELARLFKAELEAGARVRVDARGCAILPAESHEAMPA